MWPENKTACSQATLKVALFFASHHGKLVGVDDERLTIVLGHDVEDYSRYEQQIPR